MNKPNFRMRNNLVLIRREKRSEIRGLAMPERSQEGACWFVE